MRTTWRTPIASADSAATSISEYPARSNPVVKVIRSGLCSRASAAMTVESMPPERNDPTVTSARMCLATESRRTSVISSWRRVSSAVSPRRIGRSSNRGVK